MFKIIVSEIIVFLDIMEELSQVSDFLLDTSFDLYYQIWKSF